MRHLTSIGLDVHARSIQASAFDPLTGEVVQRSFGYDPDAVAEWALGFEDPRAVYESGATGFHLCRELNARGLPTVVGAVSKMQKPAGDRRVKTDRRDADFLARLLSTSNVVEVWVPDEGTEAARDLSRALEDASADLARAKQRLSKFLLRHGYLYREVSPATGRPRRAWTKAWWRWADSIAPAERGAREALAHYVAAVRDAERRKADLEERVREAAREPRWKPLVDALSCLRGVDVVTAFALAAEAGEFSRFGRAASFEAWTGLVPSERSSAESRSRGGITKAGNSHVRRALVEAAWHYARASHGPKALRPGQEVPPEVLAHARKGSGRLARRCRDLRDAGKRPVVANAAVARELAGWVWALGRMVEAG